MGFQAQAAADLATFLDTEVFGEVREVDGSPVACVLDAETRAAHDAEGVYISESVLHVRESDLAAVPAIGQRMDVAGRLATVVHVAQAMDMLSIRLRWYES